MNNRLKNIKKMLGKRFGKVVAFAIEKVDSRALLKTQCDCGKIKLHHPSDLKKGLTTSCGESGCRGGIRNGATRNPLYKKWNSMMNRCQSEDFKKFNAYKGRGINVCKRWKNPFNFFLDMYPSYIEHLEKFGERDTTLERVDVKKSYSISNCKWATLLEQQNNRTDNVFITINNKTKTVSQWCRENNIDVGNAFSRLYIGWDDVRAVTEPKKIKNNINL